MRPPPGAEARELSEWQRSMSNEGACAEAIIGHRNRTRPPQSVDAPSADSVGTPGGTRTPDLLLRRQLLYPAELLAHLDGAGDGNRTRVSSLEGWCSTIELHPQIRFLANSAMR